MALWTDVIDPATLTGFARESLAEIEARKNSLARYLPNEEVMDTVVRFMTGANGLVQEAKFRAYDAEPEVGKQEGGKRVTLELPAIGQNIPVSEYAQLRTRNASDEAILQSIQKTTRNVVLAVADRLERLRGTVLVTGKATIDQNNFKSDDDFGRIGTHTSTAPLLFSDPTSDPIGYLTSLADLYEDTNGVGAGSLVLSRQILRALAAHSQFRLNSGGVSRVATLDEVLSILAGHGLPQVEVYSRRTSAGLVIPADRLLLLPAPVDPTDADGTELGATFWGQTLTSTDSAFGIEDVEQPGLVAGVYRNEKPPMIAEVISDAIALPVLANANLSLAAKVL